MNAPQKSRSLVYLLPLLHAGACFAIEAVHSGWQPIALADYPTSTLALALAYRYNTTAFPFFLVMGTIWWYLISRARLFFLSRYVLRCRTAA